MKILIKLAGIFILTLFVLLVAHFLKCYYDYNLYQKLLIENTEALKSATSAYYSDNKTVPSSLKDLVEKKYIEPDAVFYRSYLKNRSKSNIPIHYSKIEYEVIFNVKNSESFEVVFPKSHLSSYWIGSSRKSKSKSNSIKYRIFINKGA